MNNKITGKSSWAYAFTVASMWFGTHVGAGFATGNQVVGYFSKYGAYAALFPIIAMGILVLALYKYKPRPRYTAINSFGLDFAKSDNNPISNPTNENSANQ
jgi:hypothetical protein